MYDLNYLNYVCVSTFGLCLFVMLFHDQRYNLLEKLIKSNNFERWAVSVVEIGSHMLILR
jgi:hypothetical protein